MQNVRIFYWKYNMDEIVSVDTPEGKKSRWNIFVIHYENKNGEKYVAHVFEEEYMRLMFKKCLLEKGISEVDLNKYEELLHDQWERERTLEEKGH
jgi:spore maturation protein CgeB